METSRGSRHSSAANILYARQYTAGRKSWLDVLNAQRESAQALYGLADVQANRLRVQLRLEIYTGRLSARSLSES